MRPIRATVSLPILLVLALDAGSCVPLSDECEETKVPTFSVSFTAGGVMQAAGATRTPEASLTFVKIHCGGSPSEPMTYSFSLAPGGAMVLMGGVWSIDVHNEKDYLLISHFEVEGETYAVDEEIPYETLKDCSETGHANLHVIFTLQCAPDFSDCETIVDYRCS